MHERYRLDVRTRTSVEAIDRQNKRVKVRELATGREYEEPYDKLILAPGAAPIRPNLPGIDLPGIFTLRNLQDMDRIKAVVDGGIKSAVVVGAGFIGLEVVENLVGRGVQVTLVELQDQVLPPLDAEMTTPIVEELKRHGVKLILGQSAEGFAKGDGGIEVQLKSGAAAGGPIGGFGRGRAAGESPGGRGEIGSWAARRHPRKFAHADKRSGYLCRGRRGGNQRFRDRRPDASAVGRAGKSTRTHRRGSYLWARFELPRHAGDGDREGVRRGGGHDRRVGKDPAPTEKNYRKIYVHPGNHAGYYPGRRG